MRITGGNARGRRLRPVPGQGTRPPLARVRQALFNILQPVTAGSVWLDLFAGTGSYGLEAASRGAARVIMVELEPRAVAVIHDNVEATGLRDVVTVIRGDVLREIPRLARDRYSFDIIGVAPPYFHGLGPKVLQLVDETRILSSEGRLYVQRHRSEVLPDRTSTLVLAKDYRYGETVLSFYRPQ